MKNLGGAKNSLLFRLSEAQRWVKTVYRYASREPRGGLIRTGRDDTKSVWNKIEIAEEKNTRNSYQLRV